MTTSHFALVAALIAALYLPLMRQAPSWPRSLVKTMPVLLLVLAAWPSPLLCLALGLGALGDFCLSRPWGFVPGLAAFVGAHLLYVALMLPMWLGLPALGGALMIAAVAAFGWVLFARAGALRWPIAGYAAAILAMGLAALATRQPALIVPALAFIASDALIGAQMFLLSARRGQAAAWAIWPLYIAAQIGFFLALFPSSL